jgi:hypothetical protein
MTSEAEPQPSSTFDSSGSRRRVWWFAALCAAAAALGAGYAAFALRSPGADAAAAKRLASKPAPPYLLARSTAPDDSFRRLVALPLSMPSGPGYVSPLECERVYFAAGRGVCLAVLVNGVTPEHVAYVFDERFERLHALPLTGIPSRVRVSPDGRRAAVTVFERGHSYADGGFSTRTSILDLAKGRMLEDLEQYTVTRDGSRFSAVDFNFWGLTFQSDSNRFYATLATAGQHFLVEGDIDGRTAQVVASGIECPSLSPDNTKIAYKSRIGAGVWQLRVRNLRTGGDIALTRETRSVDDQVEWLDDDRVLYHIAGARGADIWSLRVDGTDAPALLREYAYSPSVVR